MSQLLRKPAQQPPETPVLRMSAELHVELQVDVEHVSHQRTDTEELQQPPDFFR